MGTGPEIKSLVRSVQSSNAIIVNPAQREHVPPVSEMKYQKYKRALRSELSDFMGLELTEAKAKPFEELFIGGLRAKVKNQKGYSEARFEAFLNQGIHIAFSPKAILEIIRLVDSHQGNEGWQKSRKFQRLRELYDSIRLLLVLKKFTGLEFFAESIDKKFSNSGDPDIAIMLPKDMFSTKPEKFPRFELMSIPQGAIDDPKDENLIEHVASFIEERKFDRNYGSNANTGLLVHLNFKSNSFSQRALSNRLQKSTKRNPYTSIWTTLWTSEDIKDFAGIQLYPNFQVVKIDREEKLKLLY